MAASPAPDEATRDAKPDAARKHTPDEAATAPGAVPGEAGGPDQPGSGVRDPREGDRAVIRDALGVGVAVGLSGFAFGVTSAGAGLSVAQTCALSLFVFTGASQFALVGALAAGGAPLTAAVGAFFLSARNAFYGLRLSALLGLRPGARLAAAHWVIDETTAVALAQRSRHAVRLGFTVTGASIFTLWNLTTLCGALGAEALGDTDAWGLDAAGPAVFLALLAPMVRTGVERATAGLAVVLGLGLLPVLPAGVPVLVAALAAPVVLLVHGWALPRGRARKEEADRMEDENVSAQDPHPHRHRMKDENGPGQERQAKKGGSR
ncbi:AzlC family ABC transporter permease [Streptomyces axinellae]|uniref:AzlC family ABC transporter permease n=1 Tax=Streptomyces axinellae TaxID=552788 RepID=UPI003CD0BFBE